MEIDLCTKKWLAFTNLGQGLSQNVGFFSTFEPYLGAGFPDKMLAFPDKKSTFTLFMAFFGRCILTSLPKYYLKGLSFTKNAP